MLKIWRSLAFRANLISALFKLILAISIQDPLFEDPELKTEHVLDFKEAKNWYSKFVYKEPAGAKLILLGTIGFASYFHIFGLKQVNAALDDIVEETDEEQRPLFELKENSGDDSPVPVMNEPEDDDEHEPLAKIRRISRPRKKMEVAGAPETRLLPPAFKPAIKIKTEKQEKEATEAPLFEFRAVNE